MSAKPSSGAETPVAEESRTAADREVPPSVRQRLIASRKWRPVFRNGFTWAGLRFEHKLTGSLIITLLFAVLMASFANWTARRAHDVFERSRLASDVLDGFRRLSGTRFELLQALSRSVIVDTPRQEIEALKVNEGLLIHQLEEGGRGLRKAILAEIAYVGSSPGENEQEELVRIDQILPLLQDLVRDVREFASIRDQGRLQGARAKLRLILNNQQNARISALIKEGVEDETEETVRANARALALIHRSERLTIISLAAALVFGLLMVVVLLNSVRRPLAALREGVIEFSNDNLAHRIPVVGHDEFAELARSFNAMAADREVRRSELLQTNAELERTISERTQDLVEANMRLESVDSMRRRFLADVSHELRTPLTIIRGESDVALRGNEKSVDDYKSALSRIQEQARHTAALVDDLLFLARRETGEMRLQLQPVVLGEIAQAICGELQGAATQNRLTIEFRGRTPGVVVTGDPTRLRQLLLICLDNAIRYSLPAGLITVTVYTDGGNACLEVADQGIGIAQDELPNVFERYYRGAQANRRHVQGTGLGLPMAKSIAEAHGGAISIESEPNRGTTVTLRLPTVSKLRVVA